MRRLSDLGELALVDAVRERFHVMTRGLAFGIGDDAAVIRPRKGSQLLTTDMMVEGVHFDFSWTTPFQAGYKLIATNVSDIYAMGGRPAYALLNFAAPGAFPVSAFHCIMEGIQSACEEYGLALIGGDMSSSERVVLSATVSGYAKKVLYRSGAKAGDRIYVSGPLGDAAGGLLLLRRLGRQVEIEHGRRAMTGIKWSEALPLLSRHLMPRPVAPDRYARKATAMMDLSDGLIVDLGRLCRESRVGAKIFMEMLPVSDGLRSAAALLGADILELVLGGGEDYELLFAAPASAKADAICIGEITGRKGLRLIDASGRSTETRMKGYRHFDV